MGEEGRGGGMMCWPGAYGGRGLFGLDILDWGEGEERGRLEMRIVDRIDIEVFGGLGSIT